MIPAAWIIDSICLGKSARLSLRGGERAVGSEANVDVCHAQGRFTTAESDRQQETQACRYSYSRGRDTVQVLLRITVLFPDKN